jgi:hypothetical protein
MLVKTAIVGVPELCEKCGHCHDLNSPCLKPASIEEVNNLSFRKESKEDSAEEKES